MITHNRNGYLLLLGKNPCEIFEYFGVEKMHGLSLSECRAYNNTSEDAYIWGWANYIPKTEGKYSLGDARYVFINLQRCGDNYDSFAGVFHELMHHSLEMHGYDMAREEDMITWAEKESHQVFQLVLNSLNF